MILLANSKVLKFSPHTCLLYRQKSRRSLRKKQWLWSIAVGSPLVRDRRLRMGWGGGRHRPGHNTKITLCPEAVAATTSEPGDRIAVWSGYGNRSASGRRCDAQQSRGV